MKSKKRRSPSLVETGGLWKRVLSIVAASAITIGPIVSPADASSNIVIYTWLNGRPLVLEDVSFPRSRYSTRVGKHIPGGYRYSMHATARLLPDGSRHSGYIPNGTQYHMKIAGRIMPSGIPHSGLVSPEDYENLKHGFFLAYDVARYDITKPNGGQILPWPRQTKEYTLQSPSQADREKARKDVAAKRERNRAIAEQRKKEIKNDPYHQVMQYLRDNDISFRTNMGYSHCGDTLAVYFSLGDGRVIRYINPERIEEVMEQRQNGLRQQTTATSLRRYLADCTNYELSIGGVHKVITPKTPLEALLN